MLNAWEVLIVNFVIWSFIDVIVNCILYEVVSKVESSKNLIMTLYSMQIPVIIASIFKINQD